MSFRFRKWPRIWLLEDISQPFVWGLLRGSVYLPADFVGLNRSGRQRSILAHELSHVARCDAGVNLLQVFVQAVYWFHPLVWWANRKLRQEREKCCDEMAVAHLNMPPEHYTGAIVEALAAERQSAHPIPSLAIVGSVRDIEERIRTMLTPGKTFRKHPSVVAATVALLIALVTIPTALVLTARGQVQPANQTAGQSAANSENPAQPRYPARTFNSKVAFRVVVVKTADTFDPRTVGRTPSAASLEIPACWLWLVEPSLPVKDWALLAREINENKVPGLKLDLATDSDMRHLADLTGLQWLNLSGTQVGDIGLADLNALNALHSLRLDYTQVTDSGMEHFKGLTGLLTLSMRGTKITDAGLVHLKGLTGLQKLLLEDTPITDAGLTYLRGLTGLRELELGGTSITDAGLEHLNLNRLTDLDVSNTQVTDAGLARLRGMTDLRRLEISGTKITDAGLEHLKGLAGLQNLGMERVSGVTDAGFAHLRALTRLQSLDLWDNAITDAGLAQLKDKDLPRLQWLSLAGTQVTDRGLAYLKVLTTLQDLYLSDTQITDAGLAHLTTLTGLRGLRLNGTKITDAGLEHLKVLTGWEWLTLGDTKVTDAGLAHLKDLRRLRTLDLSGTQVTDIGLAHLKGLTGLEWLILTGTQVTDAGVQQLKQSLPNLTIVRDRAK